MSFADFIAALEHYGIDVIHHHTHWDENGILVIDYEDIEDVPEVIKLQNSEGHVHDSQAIIDKSGSNSNGHIIDSGEVEAEVNTEHEDYKSSNNNYASNDKSINSESIAEEGRT